MLRSLEVSVCVASRRLGERKRYTYIFTMELSHINTKVKVGQRRKPRIAGITDKLPALYSLPSCYYNTFIFQVVVFAGGSVAMKNNNVVSVFCKLRRWPAFRAVIFRVDHYAFPGG